MSFTASDVFPNAVHLLVERYDISAERWRRGRPMPTARNHLAAVRSGARIYATGGRSPAGNLDVVESYGLRSGSWRAEPALRVPRSGHGAVAVARRVYALGGEELSAGSETIAEVERFRPGGRWSTAGLPPMRTPRHGLGVAAYRGRLLALEGGPEPGLSFSRVVEVLEAG